MKFVYLVPPKLHSHHAQGFEIARHCNLLNALTHGWTFTKDYNPDNPPTLYEYVCTLLDKFPLEIKELIDNRGLLKILLIDCYYCVTNEAHLYMNLADAHFPDQEVREVMFDQWVTMKGRSFRLEKHPLGMKSFSRYAAMQLVIRPDKLDYIDVYARRKEWTMVMNSPIIEEISKKLAVNTNIEDSRYQVSHTSENVSDSFLFWSEPHALPKLVKEYEQCLKQHGLTGLSMSPKNPQS